MATDQLVIRLRRPGGIRWERLLWERDVKAQIVKVSRSMDLPTSRIVIALHDHVTERQAEDLADRIRAVLDGGTARVERQT